jgi:hypothetical protein
MNLTFPFFRVFLMSFDMIGLYISYINILSFFGLKIKQGFTQKAAKAAFLIN